MKFPFEEQELGRPNFLQKMFKLHVKKNAVIEISNLFASKQSIEDICNRDVEKIAKRYDVDLRKDLREERENLYRAYLTFALRAATEDNQPPEGIQHLRDLLHIQDSSHQAIHADVAEELFRSFADAVVAEGRLSDDAEKRLTAKQDLLGLSDEKGNAIFKDSRKERVQDFIQSIVDDKRITDDELAEFRAMAESLQVNVDMSQESQANFDRMHLLWELENKPIPTIPADIALQKNEVCYYRQEINWFELRTKTRSIRYGGITSRVKIIKGIYFRAGDLGVNRLSEDTLTLIDSGIVYITNKRVLFRGNKRNTTIRLNRIIDIESYRNGIEIAKDSGRNPFFEFDEDIDIFNTILTRLVYEQSQ